MATGELPLILTIDDEASIRNSFKNFLEDFDYAVIEAENGKVGLEMFDRESPDLVLVDLRMPELDGMVVLENIVQKSPDTPVIVVSGTGIIGDVIEALRRGAWDYILKPVEDMSVLLHAVEKSLERSMLLYENRLYREHLEEEVAKQTRELQSAAAALAESEGKYRELVQNANSIILKMDAQGNILFFNEFAQKFFGYPEDEIIGRNVLGTIVPEKESYGRDLRNMVLDIGREPQKYENNENENMKKDGTRVWVSWTNRPVYYPDHSIREILCVGNDFTERKKTEEERLRLATIVEQADEIMVVFDLAEKVTYVNPAFTRLTGFDGGEIVGKRIRDIPELFAQEQIPWAQVKTGQGWQGNIFIRARDGSGYDLETRFYPIKARDDNIISFVSVGRDITREKKLADQLRQTQKMEAMGTLAGGIAHDFNNILSAIIGFTELSLNEVRENDPVHLKLNKVLNAGNRARDLVKQILTFSRQSGTEVLPIHIAPIIKEALKLIRASLPATIQIKEAINSDAIVIADPVQIHQIIMNLCVNAGHAMQTDGGILDVELFDVRLNDEFASQGAAPGDYLCLKVSDTGHGMSDEVRKRVFEPFFTTKEKDVGTGMGLSVVHGIVTGCHGAVSAQSEPGKGTVFTIYLPVCEAAAVLSAAEQKNVQTGGTERILFVDDEEMIVEMNVTMLERLGYQVVGKSESSAALAYYNAHADEIDLVITDMTMPGMTGLVLAEKVKEKKPDMPVILCTGFSVAVSENRRPDSAIDILLMKPVSRQRLNEAIRKVLDR